MSGKVVNLRRARKAKARAADKVAADANAAKHGRRRDQIDAETAEAARVKRLHDGHEIEKDET